MPGSPHTTPRLPNHSKDKDLKRAASRILATVAESTRDSQVQGRTARATIRQSKPQTWTPEVDPTQKVKFRQNQIPNRQTTATASKKFYRETKQQKYWRTSMGWIKIWKIWVKIVRQVSMLAPPIALCNVKARPACTTNAPTHMRRPGSSSTQTRKVQSIQELCRTP